MRKLTASAALSLFGLLGLPVFADVTKEELKKLASAGVSEDVILSYIRTNGPVVKLSSDDIVELKQAGLGDKALAVAAGGMVPPAPTPVVPVPAPNVVVESLPQVTYTYSTYDPYYYSRPSYTYYYPSYSHGYSHHRDSSHHSYRGHQGVTNGSHHGSRNYGSHSGGYHQGGGHHGGGHHRGGHGGRH